MRVMSRAALCVMVLAAMLSGCSSLNPFASSGPEPAPLAAFEPSASLDSVWQARVGSAGDFVFVPAVVGDAVYAAAHNGDVVRLESGREVWRRNLDKRLAAGVGADARTVAVVATDGELITLDAATGSERWRAQTRAEVLAPPAVSDSVVVVRASDSRLIAFATESGESRWGYQRSTPPLALRTVSGMELTRDAVVVGYPGGKLAGVSLANGAPMWELTVSTPRGVTELERITDVVGTAVLSRNDICAVSYQGRIACFDAGNGTAIWARDFSSTVGMDKDTRFVVASDELDAVHGLDAFSGATIWKQSGLARRALTRPIIVADHVAVADFEGYVHLLARETGGFAARTRVDGSAIVAPPQRLSIDSFVVQSRDGSVHALSAR